MWAKPQAFYSSAEGGAGFVMAEPLTQTNWKGVMNFFHWDGMGLAIYVCQVLRHRDAGVAEHKYNLATGTNKYAWIILCVKLGAGDYDFWFEDGSTVTCANANMKNGLLIICFFF